MTRSDFQVVARLVFAEARRHPARIMLSALATIASACVVVWVGSGYDSLVAQFDEFSDEYLGAYQWIVVPREPAAVPGLRRAALALRADVVDSLVQDPQLAIVEPVWQSRVQIRVPPAAGAEAPRLKSDDMPLLVGTDAAQPPYPLVDGSWIGPQRADRLTAAISQRSADRLKVGIGDEFIVSSGSRDDGEQRVFIVGIVEQAPALPPIAAGPDMPSMRVMVLRRGPADAALYVSFSVAEKLTNQPREISFVGLRLRPGVDTRSFRQQFAARHVEVARLAELQNVEDIHAELEASSTTAGVRSQAYTATGISLLAAIFIIFTTLSMGVQERTRQFAVLRAIALTKSQIGAMIALESLLLGLIGWCGGLLAGWGLLQLIGVLRPDFFPRGAALGAWCVILTGVCALGGALLAAIGPAWNATSVRPLEAMAARSNARAPRLSRAMLVTGLALIAVNPLLVFWIPLPDAARYLASAAVGCTCMAIGFVLLTPTVIVLAERMLGPPLARLLGLNSQLLTQQLSTNLWRSLGTTVALSLGLGLFVAIQVWGYSMLGPFLPGDWMPDLLVSIPGGVTDAEVATIRQLPEVRVAECLALAVEQPKFAADITGAKQRASVTRQDHCVLIGVDPAQALAGDHPLCDMQFVEGSPAAALARLKRGRFCLVPDHFQRETGLGIGDRFAIIPPHAPDHVVEYEIAGVVSLPGWHLITKGGLRTRHVRSAALVIAPLADVRRDFGIDDVRFLWLNIADGATKEQFQSSLQAIVTARQANDASPQRSQRDGRGSKARLQSTRELRQVIRARSDSIIWGLSKLPLVTLLVATLGVAGTVVSSVRVRRWEFGVLRALGVTRFALMRLVVAEALLVGLAACLLSFGFGAMAGYCGTEVTRYVDVHGGPITPLVVPWSKLAIGFGTALAICLVAALGPAIRAGRSEPLDLLQAGRTSS